MFYYEELFTAINPDPNPDTIGLRSGLNDCASTTIADNIAGNAKEW